MENEADSSLTTQRSGWLRSGLMWFFWGGSMSFMAIFSLVLLGLLLASLSLNVYLSWQLAGLEVTVTRRGLTPIDLPAPIVTDILAAIPTQTPALISTPIETPVSVATDTPSPSTPIESPLEAQVATLSALTTDVAVLRSDGSAPTSLTTPPPKAQPPKTVAAIA